MNFSVFNWNIQGNTYFTSTSFDRILPILEAVKADIFCLQESESVVSALDSFEKFRGYHPVISPTNGNLLLSRYPVVSVGVVEFDGNKTTKLEPAVWADIRMGSYVVRVYNCHFGIIGMGPKERIEQLQQVLADARTHAGPAIIAGDLNTTIPAAGMRRRIVQWFHREGNESLSLEGDTFIDDERYIFSKVAEREGFREALDISRATWCLAYGWELFDLKLDWFLVRGMEKPKITLGDYISDHRSIFAEISL